MIRATALSALMLFAAAAGACGDRADGPPRASGYVEATEVRVGADVGGRLLEVNAEEGRRVTAGDVLARVDTADIDIARRRAVAERDAAAAQLRLARAGARREDIRQATAQSQSARADIAAAEAEAAAAAEDLQRFENLLAANAGSRKQRDDAAARAAIANARVAAARERAAAAGEAVARLQAGSRPEEIAAAAARVEALEAQIAALDKSLADAVVRAPVAGTITTKLVDTGEMIAPRAPVAIISDLDRAWANIYVDEPLVASLKLGAPATILTDGGHKLPGTITYISPRAEFTPRNVQTADERSKLVYRIKVTADNKDGILKPGMPVEATIDGGGQ